MSRWGATGWTINADAQFWKTLVGRAPSGFHGPPILRYEDGEGEHVWEMGRDMRCGPIVLTRPAALTYGGISDS